jgi:ech hydrogenase subunit A
MFPLLAALLMLVLPEKHRNIAINVSAGIISLASIMLLFMGNTFSDPKSAFISPLMLLIETAIAAYIIYVSIQNKKYLVTSLIVVQTAALLIFELAFGHRLHAWHNLFIDKFSIVMALIIGIIGSLICVYGIGYMNDYHHHHEEVKDKRPFFFFIMFVFLSAMFGIVFSNNLLWLFFFWEITTLSSFLLIGYRGDKVSIDNSYKALWMNLLGGLGFAAGIIYLYMSSDTIELDRMMMLSKSVVLLPAVLMTFAGMAKSAQMPFSQWLLGAMVAPTPVSALLHSSTMVKAGVYIAVRLAPILSGTKAGLFVALVGGITFLLGSLITISQSDAKKVLAYSTVSNLGLIILCAGIGTYQAVWAAILLIIFHAIAKCLLFLCVGVVEHKTGSRNIEDMDTMIINMPKISIMLQIGMAGMFLAPFGMLISKWAVLRAIVDMNPILAVLIAFGSAATLFFWVKWMGKLITVIERKPGLEKNVSLQEWVPLTILAAATVAVCALFPLVSSYFIQPYVISVYGVTFTMAHGNITIMLIMLGLIALFPLSFLNYGRNVKVVEPYMGGANTDSSVSFQGSLGEPVTIGMKNYYMDNMFGEAKLFKAGAVLTILFIVLMVGAAL